jgi:hypothetical protein
MRSMIDKSRFSPIMGHMRVVLIAAYVLHTFAGLAQIWTLLIPGIILRGISQLSRPARVSITVESVKADRRGTGFSVTQVATRVPGIFACAGRVYRRPRNGHGHLSSRHGVRGDGIVPGGALPA